LRPVGTFAHWTTISADCGPVGERPYWLSSVGCNAKEGVAESGKIFKRQNRILGKCGEVHTHTYIYIYIYYVYVYIYICMYVYICIYMYI